MIACSPRRFPSTDASQMERLWSTRNRSACRRRGSPLRDEGTGRAPACRACRPLDAHAVTRSPAALAPETPRKRILTGDHLVRPPFGSSPPPEWASVRPACILLRRVARKRPVFRHAVGILRRAESVPPRRANWCTAPSRKCKSNEWSGLERGRSLRSGWQPKRQTRWGDAWGSQRRWGLLFPDSASLSPRSYTYRVVGMELNIAFGDWGPRCTACTVKQVNVIPSGSNPDPTYNPRRLNFGIQD